MKDLGEPEFITQKSVDEIQLMINDSLDNLWMIICVLEIATMQLGFLMLEVGSISAR